MLGANLTSVGLHGLLHAYHLHPAMENLSIFLNETLHATPEEAVQLVQLAARQIRVVHYCEAKAGGLFRGYARGTPSETGIFPEIGSCATAPFIILCGVHMLVFWTQDGSPFIKILAALFVTNGIGSFMMHATGLYSWVRVDSHTMILAVWLVFCYCIDEFSLALLKKRFERYLWKSTTSTDTAVLKLGRRYIWVKNARTFGVMLLWCFGTWVCYWNNETNLKVGSTELGTLYDQANRDGGGGGISPGIIVFALPLIGLVILGCMLVLTGTVNGEYVETYYEKLGRMRLLVGMLVAFFGVVMWLLCESLCTDVPLFGWLPGHAIFHLSMSVGLTNAMLYASLLRADSTKLYAHIWLPARQIVEYDRRLRGLPRPIKALVRLYFWALPHMTFDEAKGSFEGGNTTSAATDRRELYDQTHFRESDQMEQLQSRVLRSLAKLGSVKNMWARPTLGVKAYNKAAAGKRDDSDKGWNALPALPRLASFQRVGTFRRNCSALRGLDAQAGCSSSKDVDVEAGAPMAGRRRSFGRSFGKGFGKGFGRSFGGKSFGGRRSPSPDERRSSTDVAPRFWAGERRVSEELSRGSRTARLQTHKTSRGMSTAPAFGGAAASDGGSSEVEALQLPHEPGASSPPGDRKPSGAGVQLQEAARGGTARNVVQVVVQPPGDGDGDGEEDLLVQEALDEM